MKRYASVDTHERLFTFGGGNFFGGWLAITIYRYQYLFIPTIGIFRTRHNFDLRIGFNWLNFAISIRLTKVRGEDEENA